MSSSVPPFLPPALPPDGALPVFEPPDVPDYDALVTEDDAPLDSRYTEKQQRLLAEPLYSSWPGPGDGRPFVVMANVGYFFALGQPPLVPDCLLSLDVSPAADLRAKENRSYFTWVMGKPPEVVIEIVSDRRGDEGTLKRRTYARQGVLFYVLYDPDDLLGGGVVRAHVLQRGQYDPVAPGWLPEVGLGLTLWQGPFEGTHQTWLRWCDQHGQVLPTGAERAEAERRRADEATARASEATARAERLAAQLRALGMEPKA
jgi:Uma2 family endonuclease